MTEPSLPAVASLRELVRALADESDSRRLLESATQAAVTLCRAPAALAAVCPSGRETPTVEFSIGMSGKGGAPAPLPRALLERRTIVDEGARVASAPAVRCLVALPLVRERNVLGGLLVGLETPPPAEMVSLLEVLATHAALALAHAEGATAAARRLARAEEHSATLQRLAGATHRADVAERALDMATTLFGADRAAIFLLDEKEDVVTSWSRRLSRRWLETVQKSYKQSAGGLLLRVGAPLFVSDIPSDPRTRVLHEAARDEGLRSCLLVPLIFGEHKLGGMALYHDVPWSYEPADLALVRVFSDQVAFAMVDVETSARGLTRERELRSLAALIEATVSAPRSERLAAGLASLASRAPDCAWLYQQQGDTFERVAHAGASPLDARVLEQAAAAALRGEPLGAGLVAARVPGSSPPAVLLLTSPRTTTPTARPGTMYIAQPQNKPDPGSATYVAACAAHLAQVLGC